VKKTVNDKNDFLVRDDDVLIVERFMGSANVKIALNLEVENGMVRVTKEESIGNLNDWKTDAFTDDRNKPYCEEKFIFEANK